MTTLREIIAEDPDLYWADGAGEPWDGHTILADWDPRELDMNAQCLGGQIRWEDQGQYDSAEPVLVRYAAHTDEGASALSLQIYSEVYGADHKDFSARKTQEIYEWLREGSLQHISDRTVAELAAEWEAYDRGEDVI